MNNLKCYIVGGWVRDFLCNRHCTDKDWVVVGGSANDLKTLGFEQVGASFPVFIHPKTKEEYALARSERKKGHGYHGFEINSCSNITLKEDLLRRDFTINAIAYDPGNRELIDPYGGQDDLKNKILRHVSPAFIDDPLRIIRLARFATYFPEFQIDPGTKVLAQNLSNSGELSNLSLERITQEIIKVYKYSDQPYKFWVVLDELNALDKIFPNWNKILPHVLPLLQKKITDLNPSQSFSYAMAVWHQAAMRMNEASPQDSLKLSSYHIKLINIIIKAWGFREKNTPDSVFVLEVIFLTKALQETTLIQDVWAIVGNPILKYEQVSLLVKKLKSLDTSWIVKIEPPAKRHLVLKDFYQEYIQKELNL